MTEKELKKMNRSQLLDLLMVQMRRTDDLESKLAEAERQLHNKTIAEKEAGSIAEAALKVNGVFEAAEAAAQQYLENIRLCSERCDQMIADTKSRCQDMESRAYEKMAQLKAEVDRLQAEWEAAAEQT